MKDCPDCGCRVYNSHCVNCHEETYIYEQNISNDEISPMSQEFIDKVNKQSKEAKELRGLREKREVGDAQYPRNKV